VRVDWEGTLLCEEWPDMQSVLALVQVLKTNAAEAEMLIGSSDIQAAAKLLHELGPREIVLTHRDVALVYGGYQFHEATFFPKKPIGRSGRGDTCIASYMASRLKAPPAEELSGRRL